MTRSPDAVVRVALAGCGAIARAVHLPTLARMGGVRITGLVDPSAEALRAAASFAPQATTATSLAELIADAAVDGAPDAVVVCTPTPLLAATAVAAFDAGRHVYVEKPLATSEHDALALHAAWRRAGRVGIVGFNYRQHPLLQQARRLLREGVIGDLVGVHGIFTSRPAALPAWKQHRDGGGVLFDRASHHVDLVSWLASDTPVEAWATESDRRTPGDTATIACRFASGTVLQGLYSHDAATEDHLTLVGTLGRMSIDRLAGLGVELTRGPGDRSVVRRLRSGARLLSRDAFARLRLRRPDAEPSFRLALTRFVESVRRSPDAPGHGAGPLPTIDDGLRCLGALLAARRSVASGRWERVQPLVPDAG